MPSFAMTVPYARTSPIHIPRRDLVLAAADSVFLRVTVVDSDNPCAQAIELTGGVGGPAAQFIVWADAQQRYSWGWDNGWRVPDYGWGCGYGSGQVLANVAGVPGDALGSFDFAFPSGTMSQWPRRCCWCVQLGYDTQGAEVLMTGQLHVRMLGTAYSFAAPVLMTDDFIPIHTDLPTEEQVLA
jgi:hypothetical protein